MAEHETEEEFQARMLLRSKRSEIANRPIGIHTVSSSESTIINVRKPRTYLGHGTWKVSPKIPKENLDSRYSGRHPADEE